MTMDEKALRTALLSQPVPDEHIAEERTWEAVRAAYLGREPVPRRRRSRRRLLLVVLLAGAGVALALSPAGGAIGGWIQDVVGRDSADPSDTVAPAAAPLSLPAAGQLLVGADGNVWIVDPDGTQTALGPYDGAMWSPRRVFVAAWTENELVALDPEAGGFVHWTISGDTIDDARWSASGHRLAYRSGKALRVVTENGARDHQLAANVAPIAPAWRPGKQEVVAFVDGAGRVTLADGDSGKVAWRTERIAAPAALAWSSDAETLFVLSDRQLRVFTPAGKPGSVLRLPPETIGTGLAARPGSPEVAYSVFSPTTGIGTLFASNGEETRILFAGAGLLDDPTWSPDGRYLLVGWPGADQWVSIPAAPRQAQTTIGDIASRFAPAGGQGGFPQILDWCCPEEAG